MAEKFRNKYRIPSTRAKWWNYGSDGAYFITICTAHRKCFFGVVETSKLAVSTNSPSKYMRLSEIGNVVYQTWIEIPVHFPYIGLGEFVVMPNHIHGIVFIDKIGNVQNSPSPVVETPNLSVSPETTRHLDLASNSKTYNASKKWQKGILGVIINQYKRTCTIRSRKIFPMFEWQSRYYDTIIRDAFAFERISTYIQNNPDKWSDDLFYER